MEQIIKNTALFIDVLGMSRTSAILHWDIEELKRAIKWADYFQQVYLKLESRHKQREILCHELQAQSCAHGAQLGTSVLTFEDLKDAKKFLCKNILQNVWCSPEIYTETIKLFYALSDSSQAYQELSNDAKEITKMCHIYKTLKPIGSNLIKANTMLIQKESSAGDVEDSTKMAFSESSKNADTNNSIHFEKSFCLRIQGRLLRRYIGKCLGCAASEDSLISQIDAVFASEDWHLLQFVCAELDKSTPAFIRFIAKLVKEKMIPKWKSSHSNFMGIPAPSVLDIVVLSEETFMAYIRLLYDCCQAYDEQNSTEELYLLSRPKKAQTVECLKLQNLEKHFEEIHARKQHYYELLCKAKDDMVAACASDSNQAFSRMTWSRLVKKYSIFL